MKISGTQKNGIREETAQWGGGGVYIKWNDQMYMFGCLVFSEISINKKMQGVAGYYILHYKDTGALCQYKYSVIE